MKSWKCWSCYQWRNQQQWVKSTRLKEASQGWSSKWSYFCHASTMSLIYLGCYQKALPNEGGGFSHTKATRTSSPLRFPTQVTLTRVKLTLKPTIALCLLGDSKSCQVDSEDWRLHIELTCWLACRISQVPKWSWFGVCFVFKVNWGTVKYPFKKFIWVKMVYELIDPNQKWIGHAKEICIKT